MDNFYASPVHGLLDWLTVFAYLAFAGLVTWRILVSPKKS